MLFSGLFIAQLASFFKYACLDICRQNERLAGDIRPALRDGRAARAQFPGLRFAPPVAILVSPLREEVGAVHSGSFDCIEDSACGGAIGSLFARKGFLAWVHADRLRLMVSQVPKTRPGAPQPALVSQCDCDLVGPILKHSLCDLPNCHTINRNLIPHLGNQLNAITTEWN
jgi:hypothetical protein